MNQTAHQHRGGGGGVNKFYRAPRRFGGKRSQVLRWLQQQPGYALHRPARKHFRRNKEIVNYIDSQWQANLVDMLTCIDILCKHAWVIPWKSKTSSSLIEAFKKSSSGEENQRSCKQMPGLNSKTKLFKHSSKMRMCIIS